MRCTRLSGIRAAFIGCLRLDVGYDNEKVTAEIMEGYESITDNAKKEKRAAFFMKAMERMDALLDFETCRDIRDACACSKGGYR
jgi:hypothetical protein